MCRRLAGPRIARGVRRRAWYQLKPSRPRRLRCGCHSLAFPRQRRQHRPAPASVRPSPARQHRDHRHNAIVWQDRRTEPICAELRAQGHAELIREKTGLVIDAYFSATKLKWILDSVPGARAAAGRGELAFGTIDSWLMWQLSGGRIHATDASNASRTMLFNVRDNAWDDALLRLFGVPREVLPEVHPSSHVFGETDAGLLGASLPIAGVAGDQQSALFGQACFRAGLAKNTYGTGCFMLMHCGERFLASANGLITTAAAQTAAAPRPQYALEGSVFIGGAVVQWLRDGLNAISSSGEVQGLAESRCPGSDGSASRRASRPRLRAGRRRRRRDRARCRARRRESPRSPPARGRTDSRCWPA